MVIGTWQEAEAAAAHFMRQYLGCTDATTTARGSDGGLDIRARGAVAQVKHHARPVGRPDIQRLVGPRRSAASSCRNVGGPAADAPGPGQLPGPKRGASREQRRRDAAAPLAQGILTRGGAPGAGRVRNRRVDRGTSALW
ncbi:restriction endonuclease [Luteimicrobium subarcticum]|uniref:restriction endonuclease n=1 Tax=Luteimicrobium subarcticum TaxID=620910 RepID=UPI000C23DA12